MHLARTSIALVATLALLRPAGLLAGPNEYGILALHVSHGRDVPVCAGAPPSCEGMVTEAPTGTHVVWILAWNTSPEAGVGGVEFGLHYDGSPLSGVDVEAWLPCSDFAYPDPAWPASGSGGMFLWDGGAGCPAGEEPILVGALVVRAHGPDLLALGSRPASSRAGFVSCEGVPDRLEGNLPSPLGAVAFGGGPGYNPCRSIVPIDPATWGPVAALFPRTGGELE